jgi:hypothetical protein
MVCDAEDFPERALPMDRRAFTISAASVALGMAASGRAAAMAAPLPLRDAAREAWLYGLPLIELARVRAAMQRAADQTHAPGVNSLAHNRELATPKNRMITAPNVDTLYSAAFLDLAGGPASLTLPPTGDRYISAAFMDMYTNNFCILGTRTTGPDGGTFRIVGPTAQAGPDVIRSPTPWTWVAVRLLVQGPDDLEAAHRLQDQLALTAARPRRAGDYATRDAPAMQYLTSVQQLLAENPPPVTDAGFFHRIAALRLGPDQGFDSARFSAPQAADIEAGAKDAADGLRAGHVSTTPVDGWTYQTSTSGDFGQDYGHRAGVALSGLGALPRIEAMYMTAVAPTGRRLFDDDRLYRLSFPPGRLPPANAFWSLTMYAATPQMQLFLVDNPLNRYAIGDRTAGLQRNADGSLDLWISRSDPGVARRSNWLPAPPAGAYAVSMRCYLPRPELLSGDYRLPPIVAAA